MICLSQAKLSGKSHHFVDVVHEYALHSRSWKCVPFGQHQELRPLGGSNFRTTRKVIISYSQPIRFVRLYTKHTQSDRNHGVLVLDIPRGRDSWCWPKGTWLLGTRMHRCVTRKLCVLGMRNVILRWLWHSQPQSSALLLMTDWNGQRGQECEGSWVANVGWD